MTQKIQPDLKLPTHLAIIPDGNRRWAREHNLPTLIGHQRGYQRGIELVKKAKELGIKYLTFWGFSTENWNREEEEVSYLMQLFKQMIDQYLQEALKNKIKIIHFGRKERFDCELRNKLINAEEKTKDFNQYYLGLALDYGGRDEILRAIKKIIRQPVEWERLTENEFKKFLDTKEFPDPDLIIRTSGEIRTSGFLIWQGAYAEWIFHKKYFPDFTVKDLEKCVLEYSQRQRRFGK